MRENFARRARSANVLSMFRAPLVLKSMVPHCSPSVWVGGSGAKVGHVCFSTISQTQHATTVFIALISVCQMLFSEFAV